MAGLNGFPNPTLMGCDFDERAFIEMADRRAEWYPAGAHCPGHPPHPPWPGHAGAAPVCRLRRGPAGPGAGLRHPLRPAAVNSSPGWRASVSPLPTSPGFSVRWNLPGLRNSAPKAEGLAALFSPARDRVAERPSAAAWCEHVRSRFGLLPSGAPALGLGPSPLRVEFTAVRAQGAGGQNVNRYPARCICARGRPRRLRMSKTGCWLRDHA